ncbi:nuclear transport factor 2 family protein [Gordonia hydrophobica]|uniref:Nuclear transport factor 2 family protein n=1 Tax=Gordonia hydrophobica TaxID=40516 RepID=A0ABZ2TZN6_9ACTN|nr:nuclear transport factor 2 family protein [Gordonia hydrophobica]MBM7368855.1 ketosteroid isomerase-like protein [Gordonia hydrophobica]
MTKYYAAWDAADVDAITDWFADDVVVEDVPSGHVARGKAEARAFVEGAIKLVPDATYEVVSGLVAGEYFAVEWVMHPAGLRGSSVGTLRDGKVATNRDYWNAAPAKE